MVILSPGYALALREVVANGIPPRLTFLAFSALVLPRRRGSQKSFWVYAVRYIVVEGLIGISSSQVFSPVSGNWVFEDSKNPLFPLPKEQTEWMPVRFLPPKLFFSLLHGRTGKTLCLSIFLCVF